MNYRKAYELMERAKLIGTKHFMRAMTVDEFRLRYLPDEDAFIVEESGLPENEVSSICTTLHCLPVDRFVQESLKVEREALEAIEDGRVIGTEVYAKVFPGDFDEGTYCDRKH